MLFVVCLNLCCACSFYCLALANGLGLKRWTFAGLVFGPMAWPMFSMKRRVKIYRVNGVAKLFFNA